MRHRKAPPGKVLALAGPLMVASSLCLPAGNATSAALSSSTSAIVPPAASATGSPSVLALPGGTIWAYDGAQVLRSTDAGTKWTTVFPTWPLTQTSLQSEGAFFLNGKDAWAVTDHQWPAQPGVTTVWRTTDGGANWRKGVSLPGPLSNTGLSGFDQLSFANAEDGFGFGVTSSFEQTPTPGGTSSENVYHDVLWSTSDAGLHWQQVPAVGLPWQGAAIPVLNTSSCGPDFSLQAVSPDVLLLYDSGCPTLRPGLWRSVDAGRHWEPLELPAPAGGWRAAETWSYPAAYGPTSTARGALVGNASAFADGEAVLAATTRPGELLVYRSADAGASWSLASVLQTGSLTRPSGFSASSPTVWELPSPAGLYETADAGRNWQLQPSLQPKGLSLPAMAETSFAGQGLGIGWEAPLPNAGVAGAWLTADGGRSWSQAPFHLPGTVTSGPPYSIIDFADPSDGWVGGGEGVAATTDGGRTWAHQLSTGEPVEELSFAGPQGRLRAHLGPALRHFRRRATLGCRPRSTVRAMDLGAARLPGVRGRGRLRGTGRRHHAGHIRSGPVVAGLAAA